MEAQPVNAEEVVKSFCKQIGDYARTVALLEAQITSLQSENKIMREMIDQTRMGNGAPANSS